ncbi:MAG: hypothetical protein KDI67_08620, partial [Gammaproteobacteria bacterium]|nr:hypothetical protein [Gammaproteobacteria bacterium]
AKRCLRRSTMIKYSAIGADDMKSMQSCVQREDIVKRIFHHCRTRSPDLPGPGRRCCRGAIEQE